MTLAKRKQRNPESIQIWDKITAILHALVGGGKQNCYGCLGFWSVVGTRCCKRWMDGVMPHFVSSILLGIGEGETPASAANLEALPSRLE